MKECGYLHKTNGVVRKFDLGDGCYIWLCERCWKKEIEWRKERGYFNERNK